MLELKRLKFIDKPFLLALLTLIGFGMIVLLSASTGISDNPYYYVEKQIMVALIGLFFAILIIRFDYNQFKRYSLAISSGSM